MHAYFTLDALRRTLAVTLLASALWSSPIAAAPSFNCAGSLTPVEHLICQSPPLSHADESLAQAYSTAIKHSTDVAGLRAHQRAWLAARNSCDSPACLAQSYADQFEHLAVMVDVNASDEYTAGRAKGVLSFRLRKAPAADVDLMPFVRVTDDAGHAVPYGVLRRGNDLDITGLEPNTAYSVEFRQGLPLVFSRLDQAQRLNLSTPALRPSFSFLNGSGVVMVPAGQRPVIQFKAVGGGWVKSEVSSLLPSVALRLLQSSQLMDPPYIDQNDTKVLHSAVDALAPDAYGEAHGSLDLSDTGMPLGSAYVVSARACVQRDCDRYQSPQRLVVLQSEHAISAVHTESQLWVSVRDFTTAERITTGRIELHAKNAEVLGSFSIDDGVATIPDALMRGEAGQAPGLLVHRHGNTLSYLSLNDSPLALQQLPVAGATPSALGSAYVRTERGVYRPGQAVKVAAIVRRPDQRPMPDRPLTLTVIRPDSKVMVTRALQTDSNGLVTDSVTLGASAMRGRYRATLQLGDVSLGRVAFQVQDFVPETMEVAIQGLAGVLSPLDPVAINTQSDFLFGAPGAGRPISAQLRASGERQPFADFEGYRFGGLDADQNRLSLLASQTLTTADSGAADFVFTAAAFSELANSSVPQRIGVRVELEELSGRITRHQQSALLATQPRWVGVKPLIGAPWYREGSTPEFSVVSVDSFDGVARDATVRWRLIDEEWDYFWRRSGRGWDYDIEYFEVGVRDSGTLTLVGGEGRLTLPRLAYGRYKLELTPSVGQPTQTRLQVGWWSTAGANAAVPDTLDLAVSNPAPAAGEAVELTIQAPFDGTAEVMLVSGDIRQTLDVAITGRTARVSLVPDARDDQAYVLVKAYRAGDPSAPGPSRAVGAVHLRIEPARFQRAATLELPDLIRPNSTLEVGIRVPGAADGSTLVVTAVDQGILNLTAHSPAKPFEWFTRKQALGAALYDPYGLVSRLLSDLGGSHLVVGGDESGSEAAGDAFFETVSVQSTVATVRDGQARVALPIGQINGRLRVDVIGVDGQRSIQATSAVTVRDRIAVTASVPRTVARGDRFDAGAGLTLTEALAGGALTAAARWSATGPFEVESAATSVAWAGVGTTEFAQASVRVTGNGPGTVRLTLALPGGDTQHYQWPISARAPGSIMTLTDHVRVGPGQSAAVPLGLLDSLESGRASMTVSQLPMPDIIAVVANLNRYPYGCLEQTLSKAFPLVLMDPETAERGDFSGARQRLDQSYRRLADLQRPSGLFSLWSWNRDPEHWLSLYALDFLSQPIPSGVFEPAEAEALDRLRLRMLGDAMPALARLARSDDAAVKAYALLQLAKLGRPDVGEMRYLLATPAALSPTASAQLGLAFAITGDRQRAAESLAHAQVGVFDVHSYSSYATALRHHAALAYYAVRANQPSVARVALTQVNAGLAARPWTSTQEKAWVYRAVAAAQGAATPDSADWSLDRPANPQQLTRADNGLMMTNSSPEPLYVSVGATGAMADRAPTASISERLSHWLGINEAPATAAVTVERQFIVLDAQLNRKPAPDADGPWVLAQGDLVLSLADTRIQSAQFSGEWLVEEKAAGGLEAENPALGGLDASDLIELLGMSGEKLTRVNRRFLDDRHAAIGVADRSAVSRHGRLLTASLWRAVTPGRYRMPGIYVENMLDPSLNARTDTRVIHVQRR